MTSPEKLVQREVRSVARRYRREGYRVIAPDESTPLPFLLEGVRPDLIAERDDDRVIIEVKANQALRGSNDLRIVAERVSRQPGWRFELVTIGSTDHAPDVRREYLDHIASDARRMISAGRGYLAYLGLFGIVEALLTDLAERQRLKTSTTSALQLARQLVWRGVMSAELLAGMEHAQALRNQIVHTDRDIVTEIANSEFEQLISLLRQMADVSVAEAA
jgi:hypothetical protein